MKQEDRLTSKKLVTECECKNDKRYGKGYRQIPRKVERNIVHGISTIYNDMDCTGDYIKGKPIDRLAAYEDTCLSPEEVEALKAENAELKKKIDEMQFKEKGEQKNDTKTDI